MGSLLVTVRTNFSIMIKTWLLLPLILSSLVACSAAKDVAVFTAADAKNAAAMAAKDTLDPNAAGRAPCYTAWANLADGVAGSSANGLFTGVEVGMEVQSTIASPGCNVIAGQVIQRFINKVPFVP